MKRICLFVFICIFGLADIGAARAQDPLRSGFENPPASAKARTWWHWINGNVSKSGITADLEAMKRLGIQEVQIFNVDQGFPEGNASYLTDEWLDCFRFAVGEAKRLGIEVGFHNGAGWSASGGPWVRPDQAMQTLVFSEVKYAGRQKIKEQLPRPAAKLGYYQDIVVYAFPTPASEVRIDLLALKTLSGDTFRSHLQPDAKVIDAGAVVRKKEIVNLTGRMSPDGVLEWDVPPGDWTVLRIGHTPTGVENRPAGIGGRGLECNKMSRAAVDAYWAGGITPILDKLGDLVGSTLVNCVIDSYEVGCNNWTTGFDREFRQRRGYDCMAFLPAIAGYYVESGEISERFLWDFRRTVGDLIVDNYYTYFSQLCHNHGMQFSVEPYGGPFEALQAGAVGDVPMSEFWIGRTEYLESPKLAASVAHLNGTPFVGAESFTSMGGWTNHPATVKRTGDWVWTEGVNRFIYHTFTHQPWEIGPGMTFHQYGFELNRHNTWWEQGRAYMDYVARAQFLLQQGRCAADVLVFAGEDSPNEGLIRSDIKALGYDYDEIGTNKMGSLSVEDGWICTPVGGRYRLLVLPPSAWMTPELAAKIESLVRAGAAVAGPRPARSPSLTGFPACDGRVARIAGAIWADPAQDKAAVQGKVTTNCSVAQVLGALALAPDFSAGERGGDLNFIHRITDQADIYFVANPQNESRIENCRFRVAGRRPQLWNPETGEIRDAAVWTQEPDGTTTIPIRFEPDGAIFVVFPRESSAQAEHLVATETILDARELKPLPGLKIREAVYGTFLPSGMVDVTDLIADRIQQGRLVTSAGNDLTGADPAPGSVKELRVEYQIGGERRVARAAENTQLSIDTTGLRLIRAVYGKFPQGMEGLPQKQPVYDVAAQLEALIAARELLVSVDDRLAPGCVPAEGVERELRVVYTAQGETHHITAARGRSVNFALDAPEPRLVVDNGRVVWITPYAGQIVCTSSTGSQKSVHSGAVPRPVELTGGWDVSFQPGLGAPEGAHFDRLFSWTESPVDGIRHFSGTAAYRKQFTLSQELLQGGHSLELDLGSVRVIAEVIVNGKNLGVLWKAPFRVDLGDAVHEGLNELEVRITNLWPNRLIGDERLPEDFEWGDWTLKSWPAWLTEGTPRDSERVTFTTWKHWTKDDPLLVSGLLGPVYIRPYAHVEVADGAE